MRRTGEKFNIEQGTARSTRKISWRKWTKRRKLKFLFASSAKIDIFIHERHRTCHCAASWNRRSQTGQSSGVGLGPGRREANAAGKYFLVRRVRSRERISHRAVASAECADQAE